MGPSGAKRLLWTTAGMTVAGLAAAMAWGAETQAPANGLTFLGRAVTGEQIDRGRQVYAERCSSCHGANLEGQPNWKRRRENGRMPAPPHDESGHTWRHSDQALFAMTKLGIGAVVAGYESDMPAFGDILNDAEIAAVLAYIKSTWPERQRDFQARMTAKNGSGS